LSDIPTFPSISITEYTSPLVNHVREALNDALAERHRLDEEVLGIVGMSGRRYRMFINNLIGRLEDARYLEVGSWMGSTFCSAIQGNRVRATAIDNWAEFGGPVQQFFANLSRFVSAENQINIMTADYRQVDFRALGRHNVYLFDGPHTRQDHVDGILLAQAALDDEFVLIIDDWNWVQVRAGTLTALEQAGLRVHLGIEVRTAADGEMPPVMMQDSHWHNGYLIAVVSRSASGTAPAAPG